MTSMDVNVSLAQVDYYLDHDFAGFRAAGGEVGTWLDMQETEISEGLEALQGILPFRGAKSNGTKRSINYKHRVFVDVFSKTTRWFWHLPGHGDSYDLCGKIYEGEGRGCLHGRDHPDHGGQIFVKKIAATCFRAECPVCYQKWGARRAGEISERFARIPKRGRDQSAEGRVPGLGKPIHVTLSPPEVEAMTIFNSESNYRALKRKAYRIAKEVGVKGGVLIFHPFRNDKMHEEDYSKVQNIGENDVSIIKLAEYYNKMGKYQRFWYKSPHFHLICYGWLDEDKIVEINAETGWIVRGHGVRQSVRDTAHYQLSHAGVHASFQAYSWFGCMSNRLYSKLNPRSKDEFSGWPTCPECGRRLVDLRWDPSFESLLVGAGGTSLTDVPEGSYWIDPGGWRALYQWEHNHNLYVKAPE